MSGSILFYVQHLMGVGHVFRAMRIVRALVDTGLRVDLVHGGEPVPNFDAAGSTVHFLPPLRAGATVFNNLEDPDGNVVDDDYRNGRRDILLGIFEAGRHDAIITEAFPFGRRQMRFELLPLLEAARRRPSPPTIFASVRDILQENRKPARDRETVEILSAYFDHVLVHGDPKMVGLGATFPRYQEIAGIVRYTGIVAPEPPDGREPPDDGFDVVVSVGGGALGRELLFATLSARPISCLADAKWCVVTGINIAAEDKSELAALSGNGVELRTFLPDLCAVLTSARLSISRCGYNTAADIFVSGCRSIVAPLSDGAETEQIRRAEILDRKGIAVRVHPQDQTPDKLALAIDRAMAKSRPPDFGLNLDGARTTANIVSGLLAERP